MSNIYYTPQTNSDSLSVPIAKDTLKPDVIKPMAKKDNIFILIFLALSFILVDFGFAGNFNFGFTISYFLIYIISTAYLFKKDIKVSFFTYACGALSLAGAVTFMLFSDTLINLIMLFLVCALFIIYCCGLSGTFKHNQGSFKILFDLIGSAFVSPFSNLSDNATAFKSSMKADKKVVNSLIGIAVAVPVLLVIVPILVSSDAAFEGLVTTVMKNIGKYLIELVFALIITPYVVSFMYSKKEKVNFKCASSHSADSGKLAESFSVSFLSVISVAYITYLFSQLAYFFSAFSGFLPSDYKNTASAFARRGFFEMFAICVINIFILSFINYLTKRNKNGKMPISLKLLSTFILLFSVLLIITAMAKMKLNISIYGVSKNRLLVCVFMVMLLIIILFNIIHFFAPKLNYMQPIIIICSTIFIALSFSDIDAFVARYNVQAYQSKEIETIDIDYLSTLSDSAVPYIIELAQDEQFVDEVYYAVNYNLDFNSYLSIEDNGETLYNKPDFRSFNYSTDKACRAIQNFNNTIGAELDVETSFDTYSDVI